MSMGDFVKSFDKPKVGKGEELYLEALIQFLDVFSQEYIGTSSISYGKVFQHIQTGHFHWFIGPDIQTIDQAMDMIEEAVLNGAPIWNLLNLSNELQVQIFKELEDAYIEECKRLAEEQRLADLKTYKCLTCKHWTAGTPGNRRCRFIENITWKWYEEQKMDYFKARRLRDKLEQQVKYHPGSFNPYSDEAKNGCKYYEYDKEKDK